MKVLWLTNIMLPEYAIALGQKAPTIGCWLPALVMALRKYAPDIQLTVGCDGPAGEARLIDGVQYLSFGYARTSRFSRHTSARYLECIRSEVRRIDPDLIHIQGSEGLFPTLNHHLWNGKPVLVSLQGIITGCYPHYAGHLSVPEYRRFENLLVKWALHYSIDMGQEAWRVRRSPQEVLAIQAHRYFAGRTEWDRAWIRALNPGGAYFHLDEVLRPEFYTAARSASSVRPFSIYCSAATNYPLKGFHWLLKAVAILRRKYPEIQVRVAAADKVLVPNTIRSRLLDPSYARYLRHLIQTLDIQNHIVLLPSLSAESVADELRQAHVFCLPSLCENSPNSLGEAMLVGVPCVATYVGGVPSILKDRVEGLLCPSGDPAALADALRTVFEQPEYAQAMSSRAQVTARDRHNSERIVSEVVRVYRKISIGTC
jgi:glycosyltransferase involved in cell wall biosynthesis